MLEKLLEKLGLSEKEAKVYLATLELGKESVQNIAKKAEVVRPTTYVILEKLLKLGLVSLIEEGKKTYYVAENPKELEKLLDDQKREIEHRRQELNDQMNQLMAIYNASGDKPVVRYYGGLEGIMALERYGRTLSQDEPNKEILNIFNVDSVEKLLSKERKQAIIQRTGQKIASKALYTRIQGPFTQKEDEQSLRQGIHLPTEALAENVGITILPYAIKIFVVNEANPYGILIENEDIAKNFQKIFELAWKGAKQAEQS